MIDLKNYLPSKALLKDKVIAVTGAGSGIGRTIAKAYAEYGAQVILMGRTVNKLEQVYDEIEAANGAQPAIIPFDLSIIDESQYDEAAAAIEANFGLLDGLLHNAAVLGEKTSIANYSVKTWKKVIDTNVTAPFLLTKKFLPLLKISEAAAIIFTGSSVGLKGRAYWGAYAASKAANENLMQTLADELDEVSAIRVNSINPGATRTSMRADAFPAENPDTLKTPESLIPLYLYLMGQDSKDISGQQFNG
jgi:NAD(P)-dependent dehydrogenase (short-subunit alcohol dehydrogenase family)